MSITHKGRRDLPSLMALRAFEAAARLGSFTSAADNLFLTQSAISRHVRNLEDDLGVKLFSRKGRSLGLTREGREYLAATGEAFDRISAVTSTLRRRPQNVLTVSMLPSVAAKCLAPHLAAFLADHPNIDLRIHTSPELVNFEDDGIDAAIRYGLGDWEGTEVEEISREEVFPVCSPALLAGPPGLSRVTELAGLPLLHGEIREDWRAWLYHAGAQDVPITRGPKFCDAVSLIQATVDGAGVSLGRSLLVMQDLIAGRLVAPFETRLQVRYSYWLVTPRGRPHHPHFRVFRDWLCAVIAEDRRAWAGMSTTHRQCGPIPALEPMRATLD